MRDLTGYNGDFVLKDTDAYQIINFGYTQLASLNYMPDWGIDYNSFLFFKAKNNFSKNEVFVLSTQTFIAHIQEQLIKNNLDFSYTTTFMLDDRGKLTVYADKIQDANR